MRISNTPTDAVPSGYKRCLRCGGVLPTGCYHRNRSTDDGYAAYCKDCWKRLYPRLGMGEARPRHNATITVDELEACLPGPLVGRVVAVIRNGKRYDLESA